MVSHRRGSQSESNNSFQLASNVVVNLTAMKSLTPAVKLYIDRTRTHHTSSGVELPVRNAAEVAAAAPVVLGAVSDGSERVQQNLQGVKGRADHQLLAVQMETHNGKMALSRQ